MPDTAVNTNTPIRFEAGGIFRLTDGATDYAFANMEPGSISIEPGGYEPLEYKDRGEQQLPLEGDERITTIKVRMKLTRGTGSGELNTLGTARDTSTGKMKAYTLALEIPHYKGASAKQKCSIANTYFAKPPMVQTGEQFDTIEAELRSTEPLPTWSTI